jgi:hypothetical protein
MKLFPKRKTDQAPTDPYEVRVTSRPPEDLDDGWHYASGGGFISDKEIRMEAARVERLEARLREQQESLEADAVENAERSRPHQVDAANLKP